LQEIDMKHFALKLIAVGGLSLALAGCGDDDAASTSSPAAKAGSAATGAGTPLAFVPADTPYVFANLETWPSDVIEKWSTLMAPVQAGYRESLERMRVEVAKMAKDGEEDTARKTLAVMELFEDKFSLQGWRDVGFASTGRVAWYGVGLVPVLRMEVDDADKLRAFIARIEAALEMPFPVADLDGTPYWRFAPDPDQPYALVMAIVGPHFVLSIDPGPKVASLSAIMGLTPPATSLVDSGELLEVNRANGYGPYGTMLFDSRRLATALFGSGTEETWFTSIMAEEGKPLAPECRSEYLAMAGTVPRIVSGYTAFDTRNLDSGLVMELRPDLASGLLPIAAPVPGLGTGGGTVPFEFGFGLKLDKLAEFLQARASAITAEPYTCEHLAGLNEGASQMGTQAAGLYMAAGWFTGMRMVLTDLTWSEEATSPERVDGAMVIASPNPVGLVGMLKGFVPQLATLQIEPGGEPQPLALGEMAGEAGKDLPPTFVAMSDAAIGLGMGEASAAGLKAQLALPAATPPPLLYVAYQGEMYMRLMNRVEQFSSAASAAAAAMESDDPETAAAAEKARRFERVFEPLSKSVNSIYAGIERADASIILTERGLEMNQVMRLR
jgi:hypothetical protein